MGPEINQIFVQDLQCAMIPVNTAANEEETPTWDPRPYVYFPLVAPRQDNPITRNLNLIRFEFVSRVDTVGVDPNIKKSVLLTSSKNSRYIRQPARISTDIFAEQLESSRFPHADIPIAVLLEGKFQSFYRNRLSEDFTESDLVEVLDESVKRTKIIVVGDGDVARNFVLGEGSQRRMHPLGYDRYMERTFGNQDFLLNCMNYLLDDEGVMGVRSREVRLRLMEFDELTVNRVRWQLINLLVPILLVVIFGLVYIIIRKRKYSRK